MKASVAASVNPSGEAARGQFAGSARAASATGGSGGVWAQADPAANARTRADTALRMADSD